MATGYRLLDQPNPNYKQYRPDRRTSLPSGLPAHGGKVTGGIILHDAEGGTDLVGEDMGAENVAQFICTRTTPGSYHVLTDRDSTIPMAPPDYEVWQDVASNPYTVGISVAWNKADLPRMTRAQRDEFYRTFARAVLDMVAWFKRVKGITVPIGGFISRADILAGKPGLSTHSRMDPSRRSDPFGTGSQYETEFLAVLAQEAGNPTPTTSEEDDEMTPEQAKMLADIKRDTAFHNEQFKSVQAKLWALNRANAGEKIDYDRIDAAIAASLEDFEVTLTTVKKEA